MGMPAMVGNPGEQKDKEPVIWDLVTSPARRLPGRTRELRLPACNILDDID